MLRRVKKAILQDPIVLAAPMRTAFGERPFTQTILSPQGYSLDPVQKAALGLLLVPAAIGFLASLFSAQWTLFFITGFLLLGCGLIIWIIRLRSQMSWQATWHEERIEVEDGRYGQPVRWTEPLSAFTGLKRDFGQIQRGGPDTPNRKVHGLLLRHPDPFKSILLHAAYHPIGEDTVAYYKAQLGPGVAAPELAAPPDKS
jgi:hypothetical protein